MAALEVIFLPLFFSTEFKIVALDGALCSSLPANEAMRIIGAVWNMEVIEMFVYSGLCKKQKQQVLVTESETTSKNGRNGDIISSETADCRSELNKVDCQDASSTSVVGDCSSQSSGEQRHFITKYDIDQFILSASDSEKIDFIKNLGPPDDTFKFPKTLHGQKKKKKKRRFRTNCSLRKLLVMASIKNLADLFVVRQIKKKEKRLPPLLRQSYYVQDKEHGPFDVEQEPEKNEGNFKAILRARISAGDVALKKHFDTCSSNASYTSWKIQNEILNDRRKIIIVYKIATEVNVAKCFSLLGDETADISNTEQLAVCVRYVKEGQLSIVSEHFLCFTPIHDLTGEGIAENIARTKLLQLCPTRWVQRHDAIMVLCEMLETVIKSLEEIENWKNKEVLSSAFLLRNAILQPQFFIFLCTLECILSYSLPLSKILQSTSIDIFTAMQAAENTVLAAKDIRNSSEAEFKKVFDRVSHKWEILMEIHLPTGKSPTSQEISHFLQLSEFYKNDLQGKNEGVLIAELRLWYIKFNKKGSDVPKSAIGLLNDCNKDIYPNVNIALKIFAILPVSTDAPERSFSTLRRLKTYLRSTMGHERLADLAAVNFHRQINLSSEEVIDMLQKTGRRPSVVRALGPVPGGKPMLKKNDRSERAEAIKVAADRCAELRQKTDSTSAASLLKLWNPARHCPIAGKAGGEFSSHAHVSNLDSPIASTTLPNFLPTLRTMRPVLQDNAGNTTEVSVEQRRNEREGQMGDSRENPPDHRQGPARFPYAPRRESNPVRLGERRAVIPTHNRGPLPELEKIIIFTKKWTSDLTINYWRPQKHKKRHSSEQEVVQELYHYDCMAREQQKCHIFLRLQKDNLSGNSSSRNKGSVNDRNHVLERESECPLHRTLQSESETLYSTQNASLHILQISSGVKKTTYSRRKADEKICAQ
ncbi:hypothetical protein PR048_029133 [Dryococelus australis]|uniref:HAT C-terminal dimerisation domain-containing protein n=1 Tax=Dryococelus australis TaxID=614101 RepID=A0ABQ9GFX5_9NEOP|nr:hypothetical protein PR048_029133 [Dryococelus australis]